jgi:hypothetical protein
MATRRNGRDLEEQAAFEAGLLRRMRAPKSKSDEILYYFELMRRIRHMARRLSRRDDELIEAVVRHRTLTNAARDLAPENAEALRSYLSQRLRTFKKFAQFLFEESSEKVGSAPSLNGLHPAD